MKQFVFSCIAVVLVSLIIEIFCPTKVMRKPVQMALSLTIVFMLVVGTKSLFSATEEVFSFQTLNLSEQCEELFSASIKNTEQELVSALNSSGVEVKSLELDYEINELTFFYSKVSVTINNEADKEKTKEIIYNVIGLEGEQVEVWVSL